jgi:hypothetical protein
MNISIFKDLFKSSGVPYIYPIDKALERIRIGKSKEVVDKIRLAQSKEERNELKKKLPSILFAGEFSERSIKGLVKHSGYMIIDFDNFESEEAMMKHFELLKENKHIYSLFISPSGNGIKGLVRIPQCTAKDHTKYFKQFYKEFDYDYFDKSNSDVSRVCFESYDPNIYINTNVKEYNPELIDEGFTVSEKVPLLPLSDEGKIIELIMKFNWGKGFVDGQKQNFIFDVAGAFCEYGISYETAESYLMHNFIQGNCQDEKSKINTIKSAYKKRSFGSKYFEDYKKVDQIKAESNKGLDYVVKKFMIDHQVFDEIKESIEHEVFWRHEETKNSTKITIDPLKYKNFLERNGFKKYFPNDAVKPNLVRVLSNKVSITSGELLKDFVLNFLMDEGHLDVWSYCANYQTLFSEQYLTFLDTIELRMLKDEKDKVYIAYQNGILEITPNECKLIDFIDIDYYVWESHILKRDFIKSDNFEGNDYKKFISNVSNSEPTALECCIGYLISTYKNKMNNKATILNDEVISENPEGGTGKGLFVQGLTKVRRVAILDGKSFDDKKSFPYQTVNPETQILVFDDVKKNFDFESKFSLVTEGLTLERKNKDAVKLTVEESPKLIVSTNYAIKGEGNSHDRRRHELEFAQYYNGQRTPYDEFNRQLFDDWDAQDWVQFDNYIVFCVQSFLKNGLIKQEAKNIKTRKFIAETAMEFMDWANENIKENIRMDKVNSFDLFVNEYQDFKKFLSRKKFNIWCQKYANFIGLKYEEGNSNGNRWFMIEGTTKDNWEQEEELF